MLRPGRYGIVGFKASWLIAVLLVTQPAFAKTDSETEVNSATTIFNQLQANIKKEDKIRTNAQAIADLLQPDKANSSVVQITGVKLNPTPNGLEMILETADGTLPQVLTSGYKQTWVANIINAQLRLPEGKAFYQNNPVAGITSVTVSQLPANNIRITVTGTQIPTGQVVTRNRTLVLSLTAPTTPTAQTPPTPEPDIQPKPEVTPPESEDVTQEPTQTEQPAQPESGEEEIEILVTGERESDYSVPDASVGTRTDTPLGDIPQSIKVIPQQVLEDQNVQRVTEALRNVPGVGIVSPPEFVSEEFFLIRGFGSTTTIDGLRDTTADTTGSGLANIARIEVLKGPAGALFGQGAAGGTVNIVTKRPQSNPFYEIEGTIGSFDTYEGALDFTGPLNADQTLLYRLTGTASQLGSFTDSPNSERYFISPVLTWLIGKDTRLSLQTEYISAKSPDAFGLPAIGTIFSNPNGEIPRDRYIGEPSFDKNDRQVFRVGYDLEHRFSDNWQLRNAFRASFQQFEENVISGVELLEDNRTLVREAGFSEATRDVYLLDTNAVGNFQTGSVAHQLLFGFDLSTDFFDLPRSGSAAIEPLDLFNPVYGQQTIGEITEDPDFNNQINRLGIYLQDQITLLPQLKILLGGRFDLISQESESDGDTSFQQDEAFSPRVGLVYQPSQNVSLYGSYSRSFEQVIGTTFDRQLFQPERGTQYEVGVKTDWLDGRLSTTLALYEITRSNVLTDDPDNPGSTIQTGEQRSRGVELDIAGEILPGWKIFGGYAYTDAKLTEDETFEVGSRLTNTPENAFSLWTTYEIQEGDLEGLGFGLGFYYVGQRQGDLDNSFTLPDYFRTDAALYYRRNNFRAALNFKNLFDVNYLENTFNENDLSLIPGLPLTVQLTLGWQF